jgi:hypothetical protein
VQEQALSQALSSRMLGWRHSGFSVHNQVRVDEQNTEGRKKLAGYMVRAPMSLEKSAMTPTPARSSTARRCTWGSSAISR